MSEFSDFVSQATDVYFHYMSFNELWEQWAAIDDKETQKHVVALRQKYSVIIGEKQ